MSRKEEHVRRYDDRLLRHEDYLRRNRRGALIMLLPLLIIILPYFLTRLIIDSYTLLSQAPPEWLARPLLIVLLAYGRAIPLAYFTRFFMVTGVLAFVFFILAYEAHLKLRHIESIRLYRGVRSEPAEGDVGRGPEGGASQE